MFAHSHASIFHVFIRHSCVLSLSALNIRCSFLFCLGGFMLWEILMSLLYLQITFWGRALDFSPTCVSLWSLPVRWFSEVRRDQRACCRRHTDTLLKRARLKKVVWWCDLSGMLWWLVFECVCARMRQIYWVCCLTEPILVFCWSQRIVPINIIIFFILPHPTTTDSVLRFNTLNFLCFHANVESPKVSQLHQIVQMNPSLHRHKLDPPHSSDSKRFFIFLKLLQFLPSKIFSSSKTELKNTRNSKTKLRLWTLRLRLWTDTLITAHKSVFGAFLTCKHKTPPAMLRHVTEKKKGKTVLTSWAREHVGYCTSCL